MTKEKIARPRYPAVAHAGFTLIEALMALALMSIGLLGIAGLQLAELRVSKNTLQASQATALAYSLADMMRANAAATNAGEYDFDPTLDSPPDPASAPDCSTPCSPVEIARFDFAQWYAQVVSSLPSGNVRVVCEASESGAPCPASGAVRTITVFWNPNRTSHGASTDFSCGASTAGKPTADNNAPTCVAIGLQP
jgi:type IV pilus assembly protein PilV